jgi:competence protein ComEC
LNDAVACDEQGCVTALAHGALVALTLHPAGFADDCARAVLIVTTRQPPADCRALVIDQERLRRNGAMVIKRVGDRFEIEAVRPRGLDRPWSPGVAEEPAPEAGSVRAPGGITKRPADATPAESDLQPDEQ